MNTYKKMGEGRNYCYPTTTLGAKATASEE